MFIVVFGNRQVNFLIREKLPPHQHNTTFTKITPLNTMTDTMNEDCCLYCHVGLDCPSGHVPWELDEASESGEEAEEASLWYSKTVCHSSLIYFVYLLIKQKTILIITVTIHAFAGTFMGPIIREDSITITLVMLAVTCCAYALRKKNRVTTRLDAKEILVGAPLVKSHF